MAWKTPEQHRHDELIEVVVHASRLIATSIEKGFKYMADAQTQALADLQTAIATIGDEIAAEIGALQKALSASSQPDDSGAIEAAVTNLNDLAAKLKESRPAEAPVVTGTSDGSTKVGQSNVVTPAVG